MEQIIFAMTPELLGEYIITVGGCILFLIFVAIFIFANFMD